MSTRVQIIVQTRVGLVIT